MKKIIPIFMLLIAATLISVSCKSTPEVPPEPPPTVVTEIPNERVEAARQRAVDFDSPSFFPSEWEELEERYEALKIIPRSDAAEVREAMEAVFNVLAEDYDELFMKTVPFYALAMEEELISKRDELIATGFTRQFPEYLENADAIVMEALDQYEAEDYYTALATANRALEEYDILLRGSRVFLKRQEIMDRDFLKYDVRDDFSRADEIAEDAIAEFDAGNRQAAIARAEEALNLYERVLAHGWATFAVEKRIETEEERQRALDARANVASRDFFREAETLFNTAQRSFVSENFTEAGHQYIEAEAMFIMARQDTLERRQRAEAAMKQQLKLKELLKEVSDEISADKTS
jgi:tetratricopeptide (TPR) repeat protein